MGVVRRGAVGIARPWAVVVSVLLVLGAASAAIFVDRPDSVRAMAVRMTLLVLAAGLLVFLLILSQRVGRQRIALRRREALLQAVAFASERFLRAPSWEAALDDVLERLGEAVGGSRSFVFENKVREDGELCMDETFEWCARGILPTIQLEDNHMWPYSDGYQHWTDLMSKGKAIAGSRRDFSGLELVDLEDEEILSTAFVPIFAGDEWWGYLGFDDCKYERDWSDAELDLLKVVASELGTAIESARVRRLQRQAETRYRALVEHIPAVTYVDELNTEAATLYISPQIEEMLGTTPKEWTDNASQWEERLHPDDVDRALAENQRHNETEEPFNLEYRMIAKDGRIVWVRDVAVIVRDEDGKPLYSQGFMQDVTEQKQAQEELAFLAYHDRRTGLPNRAMFEELLDLAISRAARHDGAVAVLCLDVDDFKLVNDSLGHEAGDELLILLAERLREATRETDLVARMSGDQFLMLLSDLERGERGELDSALLMAESVAGRVQDSLRRPFELGGTELYLSASLGICLYPHHMSESKDLLQGAEQAMRESKKAGRGGYVLSTAGGVDSNTKLSFVTQLRKAVEGQQWILHYQPVVELDSGAMIGVEGLIRWQLPDGTMIPPNEFIPMSEELGLIEAIGDWVVEEIARQDALWRRDGLALDLGFNLSPRQVWAPDVTNRIMSRLEAGGVDPRSVTVEITESSAVKDFDRWHFVLRELHERGLRLAIDDFGTGYSSLSRLRYLPIDVLKIDRSFVGAVHRDPEAASIVSAIIELGRGLGMKTLAEGIETEKEWQFLAGEGCRFGQGFHFSRPVPASVLSERIASGELVVAPGATVDRRTPGAEAVPGGRHSLAPPSAQSGNGRATRGQVAAPTHRRA